MYIGLIFSVNAPSWTPSQTSPPMVSVSYLSWLAGAMLSQLLDAMHISPLHGYINTNRISAKIDLKNISESVFVKRTDMQSRRGYAMFKGAFVSFNPCFDWNIWWFMKSKRKQGMWQCFCLKTQSESLWHTGCFLPFSMFEANPATGARLFHLLRNQNSLFDLPHNLALLRMMELS